MYKRLYEEEHKINSSCSRPAEPARGCKFFTSISGDDLSYIRETLV